MNSPDSDTQRDDMRKEDNARAGDDAQIENDARLKNDTSTDGDTRAADDTRTDGEPRTADEIRTMAAVGGSFGREVCSEAEDQMKKSLEGFRADLHEHPYVNRLHGREATGGRGATEPAWWQRGWRIPISIPRRAVLAGTSLVAVVAVLFLLSTGNSPSWADVVEQFSSMRFSNATIYIKDDPLAKPQEVELWIGQEGCVRMRLGDQVVFGLNGRAVAAFDLSSRTATQPAYLAVDILHKLGATEELNLLTVIRTLSGGRLVNATPLVNADAVISKDLVVFDVQSPMGPEWLRVWALRESKLPVRIRMWNPSGGECVDVGITYSKEQPEVFFDSDAFAELMKQPTQSRVALAYAFLKDPGGKVISY